MLTNLSLVVRFSLRRLELRAVLYTQSGVATLCQARPTWDGEPAVRSVPIPYVDTGTFAQRGTAPPPPRSNTASLSAQPAHRAHA